MWKYIYRMVTIVVVSGFLFFGESKYVSAEENSAPLTASAESFIDAVEKASGGDVIYHLYHDFDGDGTREMFALIQKEPLDSIWNEESDVMGG